MEHTPTNGRIDFVCLLLVGAANLWAKISLSGMATFIAIIGGALYACNQAFQLYKNIKRNKNDDRITQEDQ